MIADDRFDRLLILGGGYSAHLAALALDPILPTEAIIAWPQPQGAGDRPGALAGQHAHSHIFLPRLERELNRIDPGLLEALSGQGLAFVPGSYRLSAKADLACRRLFATRWQVDDALGAVYRQRVQTREVDFAVSGMEVEGGHLTAVFDASGVRIDVPRTTLVLDAMGTRSPIMAQLSGRCSSVIDKPGNVVYITQFFKRHETAGQTLPDPLVDCPHDFGPVAVMLYPGADGWFSISMAINASQKELVRDLREPQAFLALCRENPHVAAWVEAARPVGPSRLYINPRNTWNVDVFAQGLAPANYLAVGDALTTMLPTLGANCSFAATHIRIIRDLVAADVAQLKSRFADAVRGEQFEFFQAALSGNPPQAMFTPFGASRRNRLDKRIKHWLRKSTGLDRKRIVRQLTNSSSL